MIAVEKKEVLRYLGCRGHRVDAETDRLIDECLAQLNEAVTPRRVFRQFPIEREQPGGGRPGREQVRDVMGPGASAVPEGIPEPARVPGEREAAGRRESGHRESGHEVPLLRIAGMEIRSANLVRNLRGCEEVFLMAATLGIGPDRLIARASVSRMSRAVVLQAASAAMIEAWCDAVNREIMGVAAGQGLYCRPRFSPGYGDFPLETQRELAQILRIQKEIGVSLTQTLLMMPSKSVTAVIGLSRTRDGCALQGCELCAKALTCPYSRI